MIVVKFLARIATLCTFNTKGLAGHREYTLLNEALRAEEVASKAVHPLDDKNSQILALPIIRVFQQPQPGAGILVVIRSRQKVTLMPLCPPDSNRQLCYNLPCLIC